MRRSTPAALLIALVLGLSACSSGEPTAPSAPLPGGSANRMGAWTPAQLDLIAATGDPAVMPSTPGFSPGVLYVNRVYVDQNRPARTARLAVITAGEGISNAFVGVYDPADGKLLASTGISRSPCRMRGSCSRRSPLSWSRSR